MDTFKKRSYQRDVVIQCSVPEWLAEALIISASNAGCSKSEKLADWACQGVSGINLLEHEGKYRRQCDEIEAAKLHQNSRTQGGK